MANPGRSRKRIDDEKEVRQSPYIDKFHFDTSKDSRIDFAVNTYWYRYRLRNGMAHDAKICLLTDAEQSDYYLRPNGKYDHKVSGWFVPWKQRDGLKLVRAIPVVLKHGDELIVYSRGYSDYFFA